MNPLIRKELRQHMREKRGWLLLTLYLLLLSSVVVMAYQEDAGRQIGGHIGQTSDAPLVGESVFVVVSLTQLALLLLLAPVYSAARITIEKEQKTYAGLLTTLLSPFQIWWGKFVASIMYLVLLLSCGIPVLALVLALGGISVWQILLVTAMTFLILSTICAIGLYCSAFFRRSIHATAVTYTLILVLSLLTFLVPLFFESAHSGGMNTPLYDEKTGVNYSKVPALLNPFFALTAVMEQDDSRRTFEAPLSAGAFALLLLASVAFCLRHLRRASDQA